MESGTPLSYPGGNSIGDSETESFSPGGISFPAQEVGSVKFCYSVPIANTTCNYNARKSATRNLLLAKRQVGGF